MRKSSRKPVLLDSVQDDGMGAEPKLDELDRLAEQYRALQAKESTRVFDLSAYLEMFRNYPVLRTDEQWREVYAAYQAAHAGRSKQAQLYAESCIVYGARILVVWHVKRATNNRVLQLDFMQEGLLELRKSLPEYSPSHATRQGSESVRQASLPTFFQWKLRGAFNSVKGWQVYTTVGRVPDYVLVWGRLVRRIVRAFRQLNDGQEPTDRQVFDFLQSLEKPEFARKIRLCRIRSFRQEEPSVVSLDQPRSLHDSKSSVLEAFITGPDQRASESVAELNLMWAGIMFHLETWPDRRERDILVHLFGQQEGPPKTLQALGVCYGISRQRVCQIRARGLTRLLKLLKSPLTPQQLLDASRLMEEDRVLQEQEEGYGTEGSGLVLPTTEAVQADVKAWLRSCTRKK